VIAIAERLFLLDLEYLGQPGHIAAGLLETNRGLVLVDPGPAPTVPRLEQALKDWGATLQDVQAVLVTHIHLDHSGGVGLLTTFNPGLQVYVHERGAPHLVDPERLLQSATRLYGDQMDRLWGVVRPVPAAAIRSLQGGERLRFGDRDVTVAYTPGHAWHHNAYLDPLTGTAFTGDVAGEQFPGSTKAIPVTPPPDIDVEEMVASGHRVLEWRPSRLFPTHFGVVTDPAGFLAEHEARLLTWSDRVRASLEDPGDDDARSQAYAATTRAELEAVLPPQARGYIRDDFLLRDWFGLARYWRKKTAASAA
jgi:glyoxylase-like metal-dependent hydrolase (beta-lactamase superfamily II)